MRHWFLSAPRPMLSLPIRGWELVALLVLLSGCGASSPDDALKADLQTARSWAATAHMVGDDWSQNRIPAAYAQQTLQSTRQGLQDLAQSVAQEPGSSDQAHVTLQTTMRQLDQQLAQMAALVARNDRAALATPLQQVAAEDATLKQLQSRAGTHP